MINTCLFQQTAGLGDLIFLLRAYELIKSKGYKITWPIIPSLLYIKDYLHNEVNFVNSENYDHTANYDMFIDFQNADKHFPGESVLKSKYKILDLDWFKWQDSFLLKRNLEKENELFDKLCPKDKPYTVICKKVGTPPNFREQEVYYEKIKGEVVEINFLEGYTPFDYCKIFEEADQISTVDSCWQYITEKLTLKTDRLYLTSRYQPSNFLHIDLLFEKPWRKVL